MSDLANELSIRSRRDDAIIVGSDIRAAIQEQCDEIERLTAERDSCRKIGAENAIRLARSIDRIAKLRTVLREIATGAYGAEWAADLAREALQEWDAPHRGTETPPGKDAGACDWKSERIAGYEDRELRINSKLSELANILREDK